MITLAHVLSSVGHKSPEVTQPSLFLIPTIHNNTSGTCSEEFVFAGAGGKKIIILPKPC